MRSKTDVAMRLVVLLLAFCVNQVNAHGAMLMPPPRNGWDSTLPGDDWGNGTNKTGELLKTCIKHIARFACLSYPTAASVHCHN